MHCDSISDSIKNYEIQIKIANRGAFCLYCQTQASSLTQKRLKLCCFECDRPTAMTVSETTLCPDAKTMPICRVYFAEMQLGKFSTYE